MIGGEKAGRLVVLEVVVASVIAALRDKDLLPARADGVDPELPGCNLESERERIPEAARPDVIGVAARPVEERIVVQAQRP